MLKPTGDPRKDSDPSDPLRDRIHDMVDDAAKLAVRAMDGEGVRDVDAYIEWDGDDYKLCVNASFITGKCADPMQCLTELSVLIKAASIRMYGAGD